MSARRIKNNPRPFHRDLTGPNKQSVLSSGPSHYREMARHLGGELVSNHSGSYLLIKQEFKHGFSLGNTSLDVANHKSLIPFTCFSLKDREGCAALDSLLFIDTETTGLGGSGAVAFLVGCGSVTKDAFEIRQYLIPDYSDEAAMLEALLNEFHESKTLVSFNGAAFDLPLLRTRMIINRAARDIPCRHHLDLLHPSRRLFKRRLKDCSLTNLERELFEFYRKDDIPGYLIPSVFFDWLTERKLDAMATVLEHNRFDILTLCFLLMHLATVFESKGAVLSEVDDLHSLSRLFGKRKEAIKVMDLQRQIENIGPPKLAGDILLYKSMTLKKLGNFDQALLIWHQLAQTDSPEGYLAAVELAKYLEHRGKDLTGALRMTLRAKEIAPGRMTAKSQLKKRANRLKSKMST